MQARYLWALFSLLPVGTALGSVPGWGCEPTDLRSVLKCALEEHPELKTAQAELSQAEVLPAFQGQWINPELSARADGGTFLGDRILNAEVSLVHTLELGGKRGARVERGRASLEEKALETRRAKERILGEVIRGLYHVRQLQSESLLIQEGLEAFIRIQNVYRGRPRLTPEQRASYNLFKMAEEDYRIRSSTLDNEFKSAVREIELAVAAPLDLARFTLPAPRANWPRFSPDGGTSLSSSPLFQLSDAWIRIAESEQSLARSASWPDLKLGPIVTFNTQGAFTYMTAGVGVSAPLPLFQMNGAGREFAQRGLLAAERRASAEKLRLKSEWSVELSRYLTAIDTMAKIDTPAAAERRHAEIESLFERGLIPSSLMIEAHRQLLDLMQNRHHQELTAVESLWKLRSLQGQALNEETWP